MPDTDLKAAHGVLDEIRRRFAEIHYPAQPTDLFCTFSAGVVELGEHDDALMMASHADDALYRAKKAGRNQVHGLADDLARASKHSTVDIV
jgi:PleD family two-component response regulator